MPKEPFQIFFWVKVDGVVVARMSNKKIRGGGGKAGERLESEGTTTRTTGGERAADNEWK